ncbi:hypothetical protein [Nocardioides sp. YIM 152315]|uniref:hypothetical protein n=1 Tax=Nocardioides sp. YIM 152315 TaxID=3031760 RepID=UPI0023D9A815|nr:hypothetical protein [Nocardioides sp. YIM 152315]MDF1603365.1 hypothetical protein [Nocardioides sp. YIM 152315]
MTLRHLAQVTADELEQIAFDNPGAAIETTTDRAYLRVGCVTYVAELTAEAPC